MDRDKIIEDFKCVSRAEWLISHRTQESGEKEIRDVDDLDIFMYSFTSPMDTVKRTLAKGVNPNKDCSFNYAMMQMKSRKDVEDYWNTRIMLEEDEETFKFLLVWFVLNVGRAGRGKINQNLFDDVQLSSQENIVDVSKKIFLANKENSIDMKYSKVNVVNSHNREIDQLRKGVETYANK